MSANPNMAQTFTWLQETREAREARNANKFSSSLLKNTQRHSYFSGERTHRKARPSVRPPTRTLTRPLTRPLTIPSTRELRTANGLPTIWHFTFWWRIRAAVRGKLLSRVKHQRIPYSARTISPWDIAFLHTRRLNLL